MSSLHELEERILRLEKQNLELRRARKGLIVEPNLNILGQNTRIDGNLYLGGNAVGVWQDWTPEAVGLTTPVYTEQTGKYAVIGNVVVCYYTLSMSSYAGYTGFMRVTPPTSITYLMGSGGIYSVAAPEVNLRQINLYLGDIIYTLNNFSDAVSWGPSGVMTLTGFFIGVI